MAKPKMAKPKTKRAKPRVAIKKSADSTALFRAILFWCWIVTIAITPLVAPFFRSYIGSAGPNNQAFYGYTPDLYMAAWIQVANAFFLAMTLLLLCLQRAVITYRSKLLWSLIAFVGWATLSVSWSHNNYESFDKLSNWWGGLVGMLILLQLMKRQSQLRGLIDLLFISGVGVSIIGIGQYLWGWDFISQASPPSSSFGNKNFAAQFCLMCLPLGLIRFLSSRDYWYKPIIQWLLAIGMALTALFIVYTNARAAWLAVTVETLIIAIWLFRQYRINNLKLNSDQIRAILGAVVIFMVAIHFDRSGFNANSILDLAGRAQTAIEQADVNSGNKRIPMWINTVNEIKDHWFKGVGIGNWYIHYPLYQQTIVKDQLLNKSVATRHAHNDLIQLVTELGAIGFLLILASVVFGLRTLLRLMKGQQFEIKLIGIVIAVALVGIIVDSQFSSPLQRQMTSSLLLLFLAILIWLEQSIAQPQAIQTAVPRPIVLVALMLSVGLCYKTSTSYHNFLKSNAFYWQSKTGNNQRDYKTTLYFGQLAYQYNPYRKRLLNLVGGAAFLLKDYQRAILTLEQVRKSYPYMQHTLLNLSYAYERDKQFAKAIEIMQVLRKTQPMNATHLVRIGKLYDRANQPQKAIDYFLQARQKQDISVRETHQIESYLKQVEGDKG